jgi:predicted nucleic acid-binding protein
VVEQAFVNASPLIHLARANLLDVLRAAATHVRVPRPVFEEVRAGSTEGTTVRALEAASWLAVEEPDDVPPAIAPWDLGKGESSVLALCARSGALAIIDDRLARRCAATLGLPVLGTVGLVLIARKAGRITRARPVLESLIATGMYLSDDIREQALALVGE